MAVAEAPCSRMLQMPVMIAGSVTSSTDCTLTERPIALIKRSHCCSRSAVLSAASSTSIHARPSGSMATSACRKLRSIKPPIIVQSRPSIAIGLNGMISGTLSPAIKISSKPRTMSRLCFGFSIRLSRACKIDTHVPSEPTSARATLKLFSGSNWSRL